VTEVDGKPIFAWSTDGKENYKLYNDPPGNLGLIYYYESVDYKDEIFKNTIEYYYSPRYKYYFEDAKIKELACDHHPNTPSGLGLCGSLLNPLKREEALFWLKNANMDYGLLAESFDKDTGKTKTGVGFATGAGYLAMALYKNTF
jgi:meiotically up-regulated gene 157 (Mug157) protein